MSKPNLLVSFSGGRTSAYMAKRLKEELEDKYSLLFVFANTGLEHEKTLDFVHRCDREFGLDLNWVEAVVHHDQKKSCTARLVSYETASRSGKPFVEVIKKYGIPNKAYPHCNRELKINPIHDFAKRYFQGEKYKTAIGIRGDEPDRLSKEPELLHSDGVVYPLAHWWYMDKADVNIYWGRRRLQSGDT